MKGIAPKMVILAVYKTKENYWRGFCAPFDITVNAQTKKEAMINLEKLVDLYIDGLKKYNFPKHLSIKPLSDPKDKKILNLITRHIAKQEEEKIKNQFIKYVSEQREKFNFSVDNSSGYFYQGNQFQCMPV